MVGGKNGRPVERESVKRYPLSLRTSVDMRQQVEAAAEKSGRSLAQEIEHRLELSFDKDNILHGSHNHTFFSMALAVVAEIERQHGAEWPTDQKTAWAVKAAIVRLIDGCIAPNIDTLPKDAPAKFRRSAKANSDAKEAVAVAKTGMALVGARPALGPPPEINPEALALVETYLADAEAKIAESESAAAEVVALMDIRQARMDAATSQGESAASEWLRARGPRRQPAQTR